MRLRALTVVSGALLTILAAEADVHAVEGGALDRATTQALAVATGGPSAPTYLCSGTLIAPNVVLTARHCIAGFPSARAVCTDRFAEPHGVPADLWVTADPWSEPSSAWQNVASWVLPDAAEVCGNDIAMLILRAPVPAGRAEPARPVLEEMELRSALASRVVGLAGFGNASPAGDGAGVRRSRFDVPLVCVPGDLFFPCAKQLGSISFDELVTGAGPCLGDSGAGALASTDHSVVLGVLARGASEGDSCAAGVFERTDVWGWLIAKTVLEAANGRAAPAWAVAAFPERPTVGQRCRASECEPTADCISLDARRSFQCARRCSAGCGDGFHCDSGVCVAGAATTADGGCAVASSPSGSLGWLGLGVVAIQLALGARLRCRGPRWRIG